MIPLLYGALIAAGGYGLYKLSEKRQAEIKQETEHEKEIWNNGKCDKCGKKWNLRWFCPPGSRGEYQYASIACHKCKRKRVLKYFKPPLTEYEIIE